MKLSLSTPFKVSLFIILSIVAFFLGWSTLVWPHKTVIEWIHWGGYWIMLLGFSLWAFAILRAYPSILKKEGYLWLKNKKNFTAIALVLGIWLLIQLGEEKSFKILLDEPVLVNTSRMMHYSREVYVVSNAERVDGILASKGYVDKRPNLFPFLLCIIHDLTGYRIENAFYLNAALTLAFFALAYCVAAQVGGRGAGMLSAGLLACVPLIWHQASGAGFEILNLVMILLTIKVAIDYLNEPTPEKLSALCLTAVMLSQARYESVLFVIPTAIVVLMGWGLARKSMLPWGAWISPLLLIPVLWQQRVFQVDKDFWELFSVGLQQPFSLDYYGNNLAQSVYFFFDWVRQIPNAPLVAFLGLIAVIIFTVIVTIRIVPRPALRYLFIPFFSIVTVVGLFFLLGAYLIPELGHHHMTLWLAKGWNGLIPLCISNMRPELLASFVAIGFLGAFISASLTRTPRVAFEDEQRPTVVVWVFLLGFLFYFTLLMFYAFDLGRYMVQRLSLPLYVIFALLAGIVWTRWVKGGVMGFLMFFLLGLWLSFGWIKGHIINPQTHALEIETICVYLGIMTAASAAYFLFVKERGYYGLLAGAVLAGFLGYSLPSAVSREYAAIYYPMVEAKFVDEFVKENIKTRYLMVADMSMLWTTYNLEALPNRAVNAQLPQIKYFLESPNNPPMYVMQSLEYDPAKHRYSDLASDPLTNKAVLQILKEYRVGSFRILRISRLMDLADVKPIDDKDLFKGDESQRLQDWVNQLP